MSTSYIMYVCIAFPALATKIRRHIIYYAERMGKFITEMLKPIIKPAAFLRLYNESLLS